MKLASHPSSRPDLQELTAIPGPDELVDAMKFPGLLQPGVPVCKRRGRDPKAWILGVVVSAADPETGAVRVRWTHEAHEDTGRQLREMARNLSEQVAEVPIQGLMIPMPGLEEEPAEAAKAAE